MKKSAEKDLISARLNYLRMAPRKVRLLADSIKGLPIGEAEARLLLVHKKASQPILELLRSAMANAKNNKQLNVDGLYVKEIKVDQAPMLKRHAPRAMGRATTIQKKGSHITLVLAETEKVAKPRFKITKPEKISAAKAEKIRKEKDMKEMKAPEKESLKSARKGFAQKIFRRKSV